MRPKSSIEMLLDTEEFLNEQNGNGYDVMNYSYRALYVGSLLWFRQKELLKGSGIPSWQSTIENVKLGTPRSIGNIYLAGGITAVIHASGISNWQDIVQSKEAGYAAAIIFGPIVWNGIRYAAAKTMKISLPAIGFEPLWINCIDLPVWLLNKADTYLENRFCSYEKIKATSPNVAGYRLLKEKYTPLFKAGIEKAKKFVNDRTKILKRHYDLASFYATRTIDSFVDAAKQYTFKF